MLPAACEPHAHLDKALTAPRLPPAPATTCPPPSWPWRALVAGIDGADIGARALAAVRRYLARGITTVRTHVDLLIEGDPFRGVDALVALRERLRGRVTLQVCLLAGHEAGDALVAEAVTRGVDVVGGCPHLAPDPHREVTRMLDVAERHGLPVDLHADEQTDLPADGPLDVEDLARAGAGPRPARTGHRQPLPSGSACCRRERLDPVLDLVGPGRAGDRHAADHQPLPAGPRRHPRRHPAGSPPCAGSSTPASRSPPVRTTCATRSTPRAGPTRSRRPRCSMTAGHLRPAEALAAVTDGARTVLGLPRAGTAPGDVADLAARARTPDLGDVLAGAEDARVVLVGGRVVADTRVARTVDLPGLPAGHAPTRRPTALRGDDRERPRRHDPGHPDRSTPPRWPWTASPSASRPAPSPCTDVSLRLSPRRLRHGRRARPAAASRRCCGWPRAWTRRRPARWPSRADATSYVFQDADAAGVAQRRAQRRAGRRAARRAEGAAAGAGPGGARRWSG